MRIEFKQQGSFQAMYAAEAWCAAHGISVGQSCATGPTGLLFGKYDWIAKWRNLTAQERAERWQRKLSPPTSSVMASVMQC